MISIARILKFGQNNYFITLSIFLHYSEDFFISLESCEELNLTQFVNMYFCGEIQMFIQHIVIFVFTFYSSF